jgi:Flp pilus assembly protein TadD
MLIYPMDKASKKKKAGENSNQAQALPPEDTLNQHILLKPLIHILLIVVLGFLVYSNTFNVPFVFDDIGLYIIDNPAIKDFQRFTDLSWLDTVLMDKSWREQFRNRIVGHFTFAMNYKIHGLDVRGYHIVNLLIHIFNALLVYRLVNITFKTPFFRSSVTTRPVSSVLQSDKLIALICALLFAVHPIQTQAVTYISQRLTSLAALFFLLSLFLYIKSRLSESASYRYIFYSIALVSTILAMKTKEISFTLPVVIALYEFMFFDNGIKKRIFYLIPFILTMILIPLNLLSTNAGSFSEMISKVGEASKETTTIARSDYLFTQFRVIIIYMRLFFLPANQNLDYDYPVYSSFLAPQVFLSFLFLLTIFGAGAYLFYRSRITHNESRYMRLISFGIFYFFITMSVESSFIPIRDAIFEHRVYLPSAGFFLAVITAVVVIKNRINNRIADRAIVITFFLVIMAFAVTAYARNLVWQNEITLWEDVVKKSPNKARPHNNVGVIYRKQGRLDDAIKEYLIALKIAPDYADAHNNLGAAYGQQGRFDEARKEFLKAIKIKPNNVSVHKNLAQIYEIQGLLDDAIKEYLIALKLRFDDYEVHNALGILYKKLGRFDEARKEYLTAIQIKPDFAPIHNNLGVIYEIQGQLDDAINEYLIAVKLNPGLEETHYSLGLCYFKKKQFDKAVAAFDTALKINPEFIEARKYLEYASKELKKKSDIK